MTAAVTDAYATAALYDTLMGKTDTSQDTTIGDDLIAVSRYFDQKLGRFFTKDATAVARVFYPRGYFSGDPDSENPWRGVRGGRTLEVDDMAVAPTSIIIDSNRTGSFSGYTALVSTDYQLLPLNADKGPEPRPWFQIYLPSWSTQSGWPAGCPVQVTTQWGWASVPQAIARATVQITGILRLESPRGTSRIPEGIDGAVSESMSGQKIIAELMRAYVREKLYA